MPRVHRRITMVSALARGEPTVLVGAFAVWVEGALPYDSRTFSIAIFKRG